MVKPLKVMCDAITKDWFRVECDDTQVYLEIDSEYTRKVVIRPEKVRALAKRLIEMADEIEGVSSSTEEDVI